MDYKIFVQALILKKQNHIIYSLWLIYLQSGKMVKIKEDQWDPQGLLHLSL